MRIITGTHRGRIIKAPENLPVRPTTDFAKTGLFNMINFRYKFEKLAVIDLFAGTGNISFEFASRQCKSIIALDENIDCIKFIKQTFTELKMENAIAVRADAFSYLKNSNPSTADVIFADPPFEFKNYVELIDLIFEKNLLKEKGSFILEHHSKRHFAVNKYFIEERKYGNVAFSFFCESKPET